MSKHCLNCGHPVHEKYCPNCSQSTKVGRLNWASLFSDFFHTITHADKSILGTSWQLIKNPGKVFDEYIAGKRKKYASPVSFFLVWVTISILSHRMILAYSGFHPVFKEGLTFSSPESIHAFIIHGEWFYILSFPISAALFYWILGRSRYSFIESMVICMFTFSVTNMFYVFCYMVGGGLLSMNVLHWKFYLFQIIVSLTYTLWVLIDLFRKKDTRLVWIRIPLFIIINTIVVLPFLEFLSKSWVKMEAYFHW